jgi:hypothetical protein
VGSENFSATSLDANRELGILIADRQALATLTTTFGVDWSAARCTLCELRVRQHDRPLG